MASPYMAPLSHTSSMPQFPETLTLSHHPPINEPILPNSTPNDHLSSTFSTLSQHFTGILSFSTYYIL